MSLQALASKPRVEAAQHRGPPRAGQHRGVRRRGDEKHQRGASYSRRLERRAAARTAAAKATSVPPGQAEQVSQVPAPAVEASPPAPAVEAGVPVQAEQVSQDPAPAVEASPPALAVEASVHVQAEQAAQVPAQEVGRVRAVEAEEEGTTKLSHLNKKSLALPLQQKC